MKIVSEEARQLLDEILANETDNNYWKSRFEGLSRKDDAILRGYFKELIDGEMIDVKWFDNYPYFIQVLKDGYLNDSNNRSGSRDLSSSQRVFQEELNSLLERTKTIKPPINAALSGTNIQEYNMPSEEWVNDVEIFYNKYLTNHPLSDRIKRLLFHRGLNAYTDLVGCLKSISKDKAFINTMGGMEKMPDNKLRNGEGYEYDVFLSHANKDKAEIVDELNSSLERLGIKIFYDKKTLEWGDNWKERILRGTERAEFAIIVISENFFGREWTEKELSEFMNRQNKLGQKTVLPILHHITMDSMQERYPQVADIQTISSSDYTCDQIALLFARQLIKRLRDWNSD